MQACVSTMMVHLSRLVYQQLYMYPGPGVKGKLNVRECVLAHAA